ncbi:hypothetical protein [Burkholderia pyrrocinia]|uniref:hypothetical protein n=1 Tax=Burkholderia pyrrocinia TaxID=60550 RepID=UPI001404402C|nr:hypothetical protein [Burkholderia pyrrocinia]
MRLPICRTADYPTNVNARTIDLQHKRDATSLQAASNMAQRCRFLKGVDLQEPW